MADLNIIDKKVAPICCHLRSKGMHMFGTTDAVEAGGPGTGDGYFWCLKTMHLFGPDNEAVNRAACQSGRGCFETL